MIFELNTLKKQAQDYVLRLFDGSAEDESALPSHPNYYTCARCGTYARLHR